MVETIAGLNQQALFTLGCDPIDAYILRYILDSKHKRQEEYSTPLLPMFGEYLELNAFLVREAFPIIHRKEAIINRRMQRFLHIGFLQHIPPKEIVSQLQYTCYNHRGYGANVCSWCHISVFILHQHHYPIPKSQGGQETVGICPNCHYNFHYALSHVVSITTRLTELEQKEPQKELGTFEKEVHGNNSS
jgi:hypothetical protein